MQVTTQSDPLSRVASALKGAAQATGAGFDYLLRTAKRESSLDAKAQAPTSSARGLFQFIEQTWLQTMKEDGGKLGLGDQAADITKTASGRYTVADADRKAELLAMRDDPQTAALMAGALTQRNAATLTSALGRAPTEGELYAAHFLGAKGAVDLVTTASSTPNVSAASVFPAQASANRAIFYDKGRPRTVGEVYAKVTAGHDATVTATAPVTRALAYNADDDTAIGPFNGGVENDGQAFHSLFKTGRRSPVSSYVSQTWSAFAHAGMAADTKTVAALKASATAQATATASAQAVQTVQPVKTASAAPVATSAAARRQAATLSQQQQNAAALAAFAADARAALANQGFSKAEVAPPTGLVGANRTARK